ncbi:MAG: hypothetical protein E7515_06490 [Ruminococcaceae bacterium]|jgi:hypothetical protein|nr:hypothetical protein [Oscillospiraceae bacterium]
MNKTRKIRSAFAVVLSFVLSLCVVALALLGVARFTALSPSFAKRSIEKSGFGEKKLAEIKTEFISYGNACNIGDDFFNSFFETTLTGEYIEKNATDYYEKVYTQKDASPDSAEIEQLLKPALVKYAEEKGYADVDSLDEDLDVIVSELGQIYRSVLALPSSSTITSMIVRFTRLCNYALLASAVLSLLAAMMLLLIFKPKVYSFRYLIYAFSGSFLMLLALPLYVRIANLIGKVNIVSKALYSFVVSFGNGVLDSVIISACCCAVITAACVLVYVKLSKKEN